MVKLPVISVNKLGEYLICRAARKRSLLHQRKYPDPDFQVGRYYQETEDAIQKYMTTGAVDPRLIENELNSLYQKTPEKSGTARRIASNIERLECFEDMLDDIDLTDIGSTAGSSRAKHMKICGVAISVRPEIILRGVGPRKQKLIGALKLQLTKSTDFDEEAARYVSVLVQEYCKCHLVQDNEIVHAPYCKVIDVGNEIVHPGVKSRKRRMRDIEAECQNISAIWASI